jgi:hypothetical protein
MRLIGLLPALLAVVGVVVQPTVPAYATASDGFVRSSQTRQDLREWQPLLAGQTLDEFILDAQISPDVRAKLADRAAYGEAAILSQAQMRDMAQTHPALYAKLMRAYRTATTPNLTADEKALVTELTAGNIEAFKAGSPIESCGAKLASADSLVGYLPENCPGSSAVGAWVLVALLTVIIGIPLFCAIFSGPAFCRGMTGP